MSSAMNDPPSFEELMQDYSPLPPTPPLDVPYDFPEYPPHSPDGPPPELDPPSPDEPQQLEMIADRYPEPPPRQNWRRNERRDDRRTANYQRRSNFKRRPPNRDTQFNRAHQRRPGPSQARSNQGAWKPPYTPTAGRLEPHFHAQSRAVLCIRDGFTLTNGFISYAADHGNPIEHVIQLRVGKLWFTDDTTQRHWKKLLERESTTHPAQTLQTRLLEGVTQDPCPLCRAARCHRHVAVQGIRKLLHTDDVERIPHPVLRF